jgi:hypothetical protein
MNDKIRNFCIIAHIDHPVPLRYVSGIGRDSDFNYFVI